MILMLPVWLYITFICLVWGNLLAGFSFKGIRFSSAPLSPYILCFAGLALIGILSFYLSLFIPLSVTAHLIILFPVLIYLLFPKNRERLKIQIRQFAQGFTASTALLAGSCILLTLLIGSYKIIHPDTLSYHAQAIRWMEQYKAIKGQAFIDYEVAMQSSWFSMQAIFRFNFLAPNNYLFLNGCVVCWFILFVCSRLQPPKNVHTGTYSSSNSLAWLALLAFCFFSWTQVRLTSISASPDFITSIYIWLAVYLFYTAGKHPGNQPAYAVVFFCCSAVTIKLSAIIILLLPAIIIIRFLFLKRFLPAALFILTGCILLFPLLARNVIASGYLLYPANVFNWFSVDWKLDLFALNQFRDYISAYARYPVEGFSEAQAALQLPLQQWLPQWWRQLTLINQFLLSAVIALLFFNLVSIKQQLRKRTATQLILLTVALAGTVFWFITAPHPRLATGFFIPLVFLLGKGINLPVLYLKPLFHKTVLISCSVLILGYCGYRVVNYFEPRQVLVPAGTGEMRYTTISCDGGLMNRAALPNYCGFMPAPCINDSCRHFRLRGKEITDGFQKK